MDLNSVVIRGDIRPQPIQLYTAERDSRHGLRHGPYWIDLSAKVLDMALLCIKA